MADQHRRLRRRCKEEVVRGSVGDMSEGSILWFMEHEGLNGHGYIPGTDLGDDQCSKEEYIAFWGPKNYFNGGRYRKKVSPRMGRHIRRLYQLVFQRPIGAADTIPYQFGRALLAERKGHPINWAAYARKMTHRGTGDMAHLSESLAEPAGLRRNGAPFTFVSMEALRGKTPPGNWPKNEESLVSDGEGGSPDDWEINVKHFPAMVGDSVLHDQPQVLIPATTTPKAAENADTLPKEQGNSVSETFLAWPWLYGRELL